MQIIDGFSFETEEEIARARKESEGIKYIKEHTQMDNPEVVLTLYTKLVEDSMLTTPVGVAFLVELQDYLKESPTVEDGLIKPIPSTCLRSERNKGTSKKTSETNYSLNKVSLWFNVVLVIVVVGMFAISLLTGNNVNIINYENEIIDKYESWETELNDREAIIREKEAELGINGEN